MHSTGGCATSRQVLIIQVRAFSAVRGSDALFPNDFGEDLLTLGTFPVALTQSGAALSPNVFDA